MTGIRLVSIPQNLSLTTLALGGATIGTDALAVTGTANISGSITTGGSLVPSGNLALANAGNNINWSGRAVLKSPQDAALQIGSNSGGALVNLSVPATASLQFGLADVDTAPVAQTLRVQGPLVGGTSNIAGPNWTLLGALGKGNANSGDIIFQTGGAVGASGTTIATATTALTIKGVTGALTIASGKSLLLGNAATTGLAAGVLAALTNATIVISDSGGQAYRIPCII